MRRLLTSVLVLSLVALEAPGPARGNSPVTPAFRPDPKTVRRQGPAYRYPQAGWTVLHVEGEPYERGYQHGWLMAPEIAAYIRCSGTLRSPRAPADGWRNTRSLVNALFLRRYDREYLEEMKGIADGATAAGARFDGRPVDLVDVVGLNSWPEIETLDPALEATPTGLEAVQFAHAQPRAAPPARPMHCSAFAATGPATADGKIVFGHITMFNLYPSHFYNVWLDVKPARGHRVLMQTYPGGVQSGLDYYLNDAGLIVCETTLAQTRFDGKGMAEGSRIRQALQYADSIDRVVEVLGASNNGLYTNEWLLADVKTNEIALFELGTTKSKLYRSSKKEWFGGTEGFYWGCNNTKDLDVRMETVADVSGRPANVVWRPSERDKTWLKLFARHRGKIDAAFAREAFTTPPVAAYYSLDAKFTTTDLARELKSWGLFGPPLGRTWEPTREEVRKYPEIRPLVSNPWTILDPSPPPPAEANEPPAVDLPDRIEKVPRREREEEKVHATEAAWHGTLLPRTDADVWLAAAFPDYERVVALEKALKEERKEEKQEEEVKEEGRQAAEDRDRLAVELFSYRSAYLARARAGGDRPLAATSAEMTGDDWYWVAAGKGVLLLHELHRLLGDPQFEQVMDSFGRSHAGKEVTAAEFQAHVEQAAGKSFQAFFDSWLKQPGLPALQLVKVRCSRNRSDHSGPSSAAEYQVEGEIARDGTTAPVAVDVTVETAKGEVTKTVVLDSPRTAFHLDTADPPRRLVVDKYGRTARANGGPFSVLSFYSDLEHTLIVYGTADEAPTNKEAAEALQRSIRERWSNVTVPIQSDLEVTDALLRGHHLLLVGRPDCNRVVDRFRATLPVTFGSRSFVVREETYAHPGSAVIAAGENPLNRAYSLVAFAGLGAESTLESASALLRRGQPAGEVLVLPHEGKPRALTVPARDLVHEFKKP